MSLTERSTPQRKNSNIQRLSSFRTHVNHTIANLGLVAENSVPTVILGHFGEWLEWPDWLRDGTSLSGSGPLPPFISLADDLNITANIIEHVGEDQFLKRIMQEVHQPTGPFAELSFANAPTLGHALEALVRLINLNGGHLRASLEKTGAILHFNLEDVVPLGRTSDPLGLTKLIYAYRLIASSKFDLSQDLVLNSTYPNNRHARAIGTLFQCKIVTGAPANGLLMPLHWADKANISFNDSLWKLANEQIAHAERERSPSAALMEIRVKVAQILSDRHRAPRLKQMAAETGVSPRTITRLLAAQGTSFHEIVEQERRYRASKLINDPSLSLQTIATSLGFTDMSSFGRSFRLWFGQTPGRVRNGARGASTIS